MNPNTTIRSKQILANPIKAYASTQSTNTTEQQHQLETLCSQIDALKKQENDLQLACKKLSRNIGEAKRNNQSIDTLRQDMQALSQQIKPLKQQISAHQQTVLSFFDTGSDTDTDNDDSDKPWPVTRRYNKTSCDPDKIIIKRLTTEQQQWNDYINTHADACIHHLSEWESLLNQSYGHECHYYFALDEKNRIVGTLPLVRLNSRLFGDLLVSMPFFQRAGSLADHPSIEQKLIDHANQVASDLGIDHIEYRDDIEREGMAVQSHKVNMVLALPDTIDSLWQNFSSKLRAQIRRPQRENPDIKIGHKELLHDFYAVYARNMRDLGSPLHSKKFIANILDQFPHNSWLVVLRLKNKPVAAGFLLGYGDTLEIPLASTIQTVNHLSLNMLLYWQVLQLAIQKGYRKFDFGRSTKDAGTYNFKKQWGARAKPLYWHYWLRDGDEMPGLNPNNPKFALVIALWKRLPVSVSKWLGPYIIKNIP